MEPLDYWLGKEKHEKHDKHDKHDKGDKHPCMHAISCNFISFINYY